MFLNILHEGYLRTISPEDRHFHDPLHPTSISTNSTTTRYCSIITTKIALAVVDKQFRKENMQIGEESYLLHVFDIFLLKKDFLLQSS